jgi:hypothetical protein
MRTFLLGMLTARASSPSVGSPGPQPPAARYLPQLALSWSSPSQLLDPSLTSIAWLLDPTRTSVLYANRMS